MSLVDIPEIGLQIPQIPLAAKALAFCKEHCSEPVYNHAVRAAYWALIISQRLPKTIAPSPDLDIVVVGCILHDMGWARTAGLLSKDKRFEVDSANIARDFLDSQPLRETWGQDKIQRMWDGIALHATPSIAKFGAPEVALIHLGVIADFVGPSVSLSTGESDLILLDEYHAVMKLFPRAGFNRDGFKDIMCWLCHEKAETTYDNWVSGFGLKFGTDGNGTDRETFAHAWEENQFASSLLLALDKLEALDNTA
ncbi:hypothetical protein LTR84_004521 [Exophiala bonariae]|uniref:HD domain-containing protein n=1 Tax=Exophiala bonariae TaxID=1690606 RepID=A0AAV9NQX1_9EURO|nr:hypothetical protein LTR84_004521 [Exophiala bonariae]